MDRTFQSSGTSQALVLLSTSMVMLGIYYAYDSIGSVAELLSRQLHFSDIQIGSLNAIYSLPNIFLALVGGVVIDRYGPRAILVMTSSICFLGALMVALGGNYPLMLCGRLLFGIGAETALIATLVALSQSFLGRSLALAVALNFSLARVGSYLADRSPSFAAALYEHGWQPPLCLAAGFALVTLLSALMYGWIDHRMGDEGALRRATPTDRINWRDLLHFRKEYWYLVGVCVAFYSVIVPFRSTFAIKYFQQAHGLTLSEASRMNSYVFMAAIFATPVFGWWIDRAGRHTLLIFVGSALLPIAFLLLGSVQSSLWAPTALLGVSFSLVPAVLWPAVARYATSGQRGTAYGLASMLQNTGQTLSNLFVGYLNDCSLANGANPDGYKPMLWFFGTLGLVGLLFAVSLKSTEAPDVGNSTSTVRAPE